MANSTGSTVRLLGPTVREAHTAKGPISQPTTGAAEMQEHKPTRCNGRLPFYSKTWGEAVSKDEQQAGKRNNKRPNRCIDRFGITEVKYRKSEVLLKRDLRVKPKVQWRLAVVLPVVVVVLVGVVDVRNFENSNGA